MGAWRSPGLWRWVDMGGHNDVRHNGQSRSERCGGAMVGVQPSG